MAGKLFENSWQTSYERCQACHRDVWTFMSQRSSLPRTSRGYVNLTESINDAMKKFTCEIDALQRQLESERSSVTSGEYVRLDGLASVLRSQEGQLKSMLSQASVSADQREEERKRQMLFNDGAGVSESAGVRWGAPPPSTNYGATDDDINADSGPSVEKVIKEQDEGLDQLHSIIVRQRNIAENIESEVGTQNDLIDRLGDDMDRTNVHLLSTTLRVQVVNRTSGVKRYWIVIFLLFIVIVIIICIPS